MKLRNTGVLGQGKGLPQSGNNEYGHMMGALGKTRDAWRFRGSLIPRDRKIGVDNCKTPCLDSASCYSTPFYASPVLIHT